MNLNKRSQSDNFYLSIYLSECRQKVLRLTKKEKH